MIQKFYDLEIITNGQRLYNFTNETEKWIKKNNFSNGFINLINSETEKVIKFNNEKISRPFINNANIFLIKNNGIIRSN